MRDARCAMPDLCAGSLSLHLPLLTVQTLTDGGGSIAFGDLVLVVLLKFGWWWLSVELLRFVRI